MIGVWQINTPEVNSGYFDTYQFFTDGSFKFNTNQNDGLRRVLGIGGKYKLNKGVLTFIVEYTKEIVGGAIARSEITTGSDSWAIEGGQISKKKLLKPIKVGASIEIGKKSNGTDCIIIDKRNYFKVDNDPNNFE